MPSFRTNGLSSTRAAFVALAASTGAAALLTPSVARAHFKLVTPASWMSQDALGGPQKNGPCAATANAILDGTNVPVVPTHMVTDMQPGQTVDISVNITIAHPGWFRIALVEGASSTQTMSTLADPVPMTGTNCTPAIMMNPVWSTTQPILADGLPKGSTVNTNQGGMQTFHVTLPSNVTCTAAKPCALQVIQVMTDHPAGDCYYHHCADLTVGGGGASDSGTSSSGSSDASTSGGSGASSGATTTGGSGSASGSTDTGGSSGGGGGSGAVTGSSGSEGTSAGSSSSGRGSASGSTVETGDGGGSSQGDTSHSGGNGCALSGRTGNNLGAGIVALFTLVALGRRRQRG